MLILYTCSPCIVRDLLVAFDEGLSRENVVLLFFFLSDKWLQLSKVRSTFIDFKMSICHSALFEQANI